MYPLRTYTVRGTMREVGGYPVWVGGHLRQPACTGASSSDKYQKAWREAHPDVIISPWAHYLETCSEFGTFGYDHEVRSLDDLVDALDPYVEDVGVHASQGST